ncbi:S41 family peptidase [Lentiprolixibacter aurantiacus]|uniref:S41 family peptidase n=1 Tax=Lentiprolixibacter aurantiacus TaxID=2993939 RepID=A0AAE3MJT7_9FLAO|nr:S41 family peptidase [Lentiprolixibacter aurantiacus]MCX2718641.1 S41 family peptidase [Lentiprolixibacter aurantiacus]
MPKTKAFHITNLKHFLVILTVLFSLQTSAQQFSRADVLSDLEYLKSSLEETHFDLYGHTTKTEFEQNFLAVQKEIRKDSFGLLEVTNLFQKVVAQANNAHTNVPFPIPSYVEFFESGGVVFPLEVAIENGKVLVRKNWSENASILIGSELRSINGLPISDVLEKIYPQIAAESLYFKNTLIESFTLPRYYWQVFGEQKEFKVEVFQNGKGVTYTLQAIKAWDDYEMKRSDIVQEDWALKLLPNAAYLRPGSLSGDLEKYKRFIDSAFVEIDASKYKNLIIDLRNNGGGDDPFSDYLVSYIADKPFRWNSKFQLKSSRILKEDIRQNKDTTQAYWKWILALKDGEIGDYDFGFHEPQPKAKRFQGKVYVLVNRHSFSQATVAAAQIQDYGFGVIVGEETAEHPNLLASIFAYTLPNTKIQLGISKGKIYRVNGIDNGKGVLPDIVIKDHLLDENDEILAGLLEQIEKLN